MSTVNDPNPPFNASRVIVLSELSTREKDKYYDLLLSNQTKFYFDKNLNKYVGNVRLLGPQGKRSDYEDKKRDVIVSSLPFEERLKRLQDGNPISVRIQGAEKFDYNEFVKFTVLVASNGDVVKPKQRTLSWLMRTIEELFDSRFAFEKIDIERDEALSTSTSFGDPNSAANAGKRAAVNIFPVFVIRRMCTLVGLKALVDQTCWDMLYNIHLYRQDYLEVELFARFLKEHYDYDDLLFFLYVRSVISKTLNINFRARWNGKTDVNVNTGQICSTPATLYLSYRECVRIANIIYGSQGNEAICKRFIAMVTSQLVGQVTETTDSRRMDITQFLHLAVIGYHYAQNMMNLDNPPAGPGPAGGAVDETGRYVSHELEMDPSGQEIEYSSNSDLNPQGTYQDMAIGSQANAEHQDQEMYRELELEEEEARLNHEYFQPNPEQ